MIKKLQHTNILKCRNCSSTYINQKYYEVEYSSPLDKSLKIYNYIECKCGQIYLNNRPKTNSLKDLYSPDYNDYYEYSNSIGMISNVARQIVLRYKIKKYIKHIRKKKNLSVIDIGSADGSHLIQIKNLLGKKVDLYALDIYDGNRKLFAKNNIKFLNGRLEDLDINKKFDLIICNQVIEHVENIELFIESIEKISKKSSVIIIETPNIDSLDKKLFGKYWGGFHAPQHFNLFNASIIKKSLSTDKLYVKDIQYIPSTWNWCVSIQNMAIYRNLKYLKMFGNFKNPIVLAFFTIIDITLISIGFKSSNMRIIVKKLK